jgi:hypothetical protein
MNPEKPQMEEAPVRFEKPAEVEIISLSDNELTQGERVGLNSDLSKLEGLEHLSAMVRDQYEKEIQQIENLLKEKLGIHHDSVDVWGEMQQKLAHAAREELSDAIEQLPDGDPNSMLAMLSRGIDDGIYNVDTKPIDVTPQLRSLINERGAALTGNELKDIEAALRLVTLYGQHKFFSVKHAEPLENSIVAQRRLIEDNNEFDPKNAGFPKAKNAIQNALASIRIDSEAKPEHRDTRAEQTLDHMLTGLSEIQARKFLRS